MSDQIFVDPGTGVDKIPVKTRTDSAGTDWPVSLLAYGPVDAEVEVTTSSGLPVQLVGATAAAIATASAQATAQAVLEAIRDRLPSALAGGRLTVDASATDLDIRNLSSVTDSVTEANSAAVKTAVEGMNGKLPALASGKLDVRPLAFGTDSVAIGAALPVGSNAIGKLAANSGVDIGDVDVISQPARTATADAITAKLATDALHNGLTALTPKFAAISTNSSGVSVIVAAVASKKIRVLSYRFQADADVSVKFRDNTASVDLTGPMPTGAKGGGGGAAFSPLGHFETAAGNALSINLSSAVQVSGHLTYVEV